MRRFFDLETPIMQKLQKIAWVIFCGFFWLLLCLPVITAGASTTAMFRMMFNIREDKAYSVGEFFRVFGKEFGKSTLIWILQLLSASLLIFLYTLVSETDSGTTMQIVILIVFFFLFAAWIFTFSFAYPLTAYFENTIPKTLFNGLFMAIGNRFQSVPIIALGVLPFLLAMITYLLSHELFFYMFLYILPIWIFVIIPLLNYVQSGLYLKIFSNYIPEETDRDTSNNTASLQIDSEQT